MRKDEYKYRETQTKPRESIQQPGLLTQLLQLGGDEPDHDCIRHEVSLLCTDSVSSARSPADLLTYIRLSGQPQLGPVPHLRPQHVAAADVQKPEVSHNPVAEK